jgi:hypothetical protein
VPEPPARPNLKEQHMPEPIPVRPGQIWADNDKRCAGRQVRIVEVDSTHALVELHVPRAVGDDHAKPGRQTRIRLDRFRPTTTGYRLAEEAPDA